MSSFYQSLPTKQLKKLAKRYSVEEIRRSLGPDLDRCYLMGHLVGSWTDSGPMVLMNDDEVLAFAQEQFLRENGFPVFNSDAELEAFAAQAGWKRKA